MPKTTKREGLTDHCLSTKRRMSNQTRSHLPYPSPENSAETHGYFSLPLSHCLVPPLQSLSVLNIGQGLVISVGILIAMMLSARRLVKGDMTVRTAILHPMSFVCVSQQWDGMCRWETFFSSTSSSSPCTNLWAFWGRTTV